ncbi:MAG: hypothetical protein GWO38_00140 [Phycisphaerae bacterium]|nr:hypothetical protein [Phycisphaerae bacterium]NIX26058.1 hypothetical protein [Phycisphaerae bacterium]
MDEKEYLLVRRLSKGVEEVFVHDLGVGVFFLTPAKVNRLLGGIII